MEDKTKLKEMLNSRPKDILNSKYGICKEYTPIHIIKWDNSIDTILIPRYDKENHDERTNC